jgi:hypothetical protein
MSLRRASMFMQILATVACGEIVGIGDVPTPVEIPADGAPKPAAEASASDASEAIPEATTREESGSDGSPGDVASPPADVALDTSSPEASVDASVDATPDAASCAASWNPVVPACNACGIAHCCAQLGACQVLDDGGLDHGISRCAYLVVCITGYTGTPPPGTGDANCRRDGMNSDSEYALAEDALNCARAMCPTACGGL